MLTLLIHHDDGISCPTLTSVGFFALLAVAHDQKVELHLKADRATRYEAVAETMSAARRAGLTRIGFVTQPGKSE